MTRYHTLRAAGFCGQCGKVQTGAKSACEPCMTKLLSYQRAGRVNRARRERPTIVDPASSLRDAFKNALDRFFARTGLDGQGVYK